MKVSIDDDDRVVLSPETTAETELLASLFGPFRNDGESSGEFYGKDIAMIDGNIAIGVRDASWNYDSPLE